MPGLLLRNIFRFVILILLQVLVFNHMNLGGYLNPSIYILFILLLPNNINSSLLLLLGFITGLSVDLFTNTAGLHAGSTVLLAFMRPGIIRLLFGNLEFGPGESPGLNKLGVSGFFRYTLVLVFIHQLALSLLEVFNFHHFLFTLSRAFFSSLLTIFLVMIIVLLTTTRKKH
ncbi:MAG: rod shape-determining protein MreD [Bacteroidales bacterium]|nr:rod shape-determining protein MreD [Bacteroidales bacterium]